MKKAILFVALIGVATSCFAVEQMEVSSKPEDSLLQEDAPTRWSRFKKRLQYYAPSAQTKIVVGMIGSILCVGGALTGGAAYYIKMHNYSNSNPSTPSAVSPCAQVVWDRLNAPCQAENFTSSYFVSECQLHAMNVKSPSCVPICGENDTYPWVFSGYDGFVNATACTLDKNMRGQNSFVSCPEKENKAWYQKLLISLRGQDTPYCEYSYAYDSRGLLIPREHIAVAVTMSRYEEVAEDPSLISESSYCREAVTAAHGSFEGCTGPIVQNDTYTNSTHAASKSSQKARKKNKKK